MKPSSVVHCPSCNKILTQGKETPTFPFCSKRCKLIDLGRWLSGDYRIREPFPRNEDDYWDETGAEPD